jgi:hypothetical protein
VLIGALIGLLVLASGPTPSSSPPTPAPVTTAAPSPTAVVWGGVTLGESGNAVVQRLGKPDRVHPGTTSTFWYYDHLVNGASVAVKLTTGNADRIALLNRRGGTVRDPFGVMLGGTVDDLLGLRGSPTFKNCYGWLVYQIDKNTAWFYELHGPRVVAIGVGHLSVITCPTSP